MTALELTPQTWAIAQCVSLPWASEAWFDWWQRMLGMLILQAPPFKRGGIGAGSSGFPASPLLCSNCRQLDCYREDGTWHPGCEVRAIGAARW